MVKVGTQTKQYIYFLIYEYSYYYFKSFIFFYFESSLEVEFIVSKPSVVY
jgi:hypothetical protein